MLPNQPFIVLERVTPIRWLPCPFCGETGLEFHVKFADGHETSICGRCAAKLREKWVGFLMRKICTQCQTKIGRRGRPWKVGAEKLTERVTVRLSWSELQALRRMAEENGMAVSEFIRYLINREDVERFKRSISEIEEVMHHKP